VHHTQEQDKFTVLTGYLDGSDVIKALAMGAQGVLDVNGVSLLLVGE
jgi:hypothetical protein